MDHRSVNPGRMAAMSFSRPLDALWGSVMSAEGASSVRRSDLSMLMEMIGWALELDIRGTTICYTGCLQTYRGFLVPASTLLVGGTVVAPRDHSVDVYRASCEQHDVQVACLLADQARELSRSPPATGKRPRAKTVVLAGAAVPASLHTEVREILGAQGIARPPLAAAVAEDRRGGLALSEVVRHWARYQPECSALVNEHRTYTYGQLDAEIQRVANHLDSIGERAHQLIGVVAHDPALCLLYTTGILRLGGRVVLLNPELPLESLELARKDSGCRSVLIEDRLVDKLASAFVGCTLVTHDQVKHAPSDDRPYPHPDPEGLWGIVYSSGTTGAPKGIVHSVLSISMGYIGLSLDAPLTRNSVVFVGRPLFYMAGLELASATLLVGGTLLAPTHYSTAGYRRTCAEWQIDLAFFIPDQVRELVDEARSGLRGERGAERILVMGSTLPLPIKLMIPEVLGSKVIESWGNSEGLGTIADEHAFAQRPRSVGRPFLCDFITIVNDQGEEVPPWELGRVAGSSDAQLREYFHRDDLNQQMFKDQWILSEDLGYFDTEGYLYLSGRAAGRFLRGGVPIFTTDIEEKLIDIDGILDVAVVGLPDAVAGHVPVAAIVLRAASARGEPEFLRAANERLPELHRLSRILVVSSLPRNAAGKVVLDAVRGLFR